MPIAAPSVTTETPQHQAQWFPARKRAGERPVARATIATAAIVAPTASQ